MHPSDISVQCWDMVGDCKFI